MPRSSSSTQKTALFLDGNALLHRAWHAIPPLTTKDGRVVNAAYGFLMVVEKMREQFTPNFMAVAWDLPGATFRHEAYEKYKATREKKAPELYAQIPMIQDLLTAYGVPSLSVPGFEADDILGTLAKKSDKAGYKSLIVTGDLDTLQLVDEDTSVVFFVKGLSQTKIYDPAAIRERYGLNPDQLIDWKTLVGDNSDNLPGIAGIGEKAAKELLDQFGTVQGIFVGLKAGKVPAKYLKKLEGQEENAKAMRHLVTIACNVDLGEFDLKDAVMREPDVAALVPKLQDLEFKTLLKKYAGESVKTVKAVKAVKAKKTALSALDELSEETLAIVLVEKATDLFGGSIAGIALTDGVKTWAQEAPSDAMIEEAVKRLAKAKMIVGHDLKTFFHIAVGRGIAVDLLLDRILFDTMVAAYLLAPGDREDGFTDVVRTILDRSIAEDANASDRVALLLPLASELQRRLGKEGMSKLATEVEMPLVSVLFSMEHAGIGVDSAWLDRLSKMFETEIAKLTEAIHRLAGREFNINSPAQLADILFVDLKLPTKGIKKTKSGFSTAAPELEKLEGSNEIIPLLSEYREISKLKSTYADSLPKLVTPDGRIHARFNQCVAATGRLSSSDPNLQNIPIRTKLGREIRKAFIAKPGHVLLSADYSQIELRLAAIITRDKSFLEAFTEGADVHRRTAAEMWGISEEKVTKEQRFAAKAINFGILYGVGARALARSASVSFDEAKDFIARYFAAHPGIASYLEETKLLAHKQEYIESMFGRRRYLPDINGNIPQLVAAAERMAINMPMQGTQADIMKMAMLRVEEWLTKEAPEVKMLIQVHDELVFEVPRKDVKKVGEQLQKIMMDIVDLEVPLLVDVAHAERWGDIE